MSVLDDLLAKFGALPDDARKGVAKDAITATKGLRFVPNPGPQTEAYFSLADELFYGGSAGGGKGALLCGVAVDCHDKSIIFRREYPQIKGLEDEVAKLVGGRTGYNAQDKLWRLDAGRALEFGSVPNEWDVEKFQGRAHSLVGFDEITHFSESQYRFLIGWNRSVDPGQRCRVIATGNPPTSPEGFWVVKYWAPWLDPNHPHPAAPGELRWFTTIGGRDVEVEGPDPIEVEGRMVRPRSRTFIPARLEDNPDLLATGYAAVLEAMPEELRARLRDGRFDVEVKDAEWQVIPTEWVRQAQARWSETCDFPMSCLGHDVALGGGDANTRARRHGLWFAPVLSERLSGLVDPVDLAAKDLALVRDGAAIVVDMGGGYGSGVYSHLKANVAVARLNGFNGSEQSTRRSRDGKLGFRNKRAEIWWKFREALEPHHGEAVALPPDAELLADLTAPTWKLTPSGIVIEPKEDIKKRIGRSPDKGDAVVMAWAFGDPPSEQRMRMAAFPSGLPKVHVGYANMKGRR